MIEVLWHGRGGQGAFTAARLLGAAASMAEGWHALAFPSFGPERRGAPIKAFTKIADAPIGDRSAIGLADYVVYLDDTLLGDDWASELKPGGIVLVNSPSRFDDARVVALDADGLSARILGRPIPNTVFLGALSALGVVGLDEVKQAIRTYMPKKLHGKNEQIVEEAREALASLLPSESLSALTRHPGSLDSAPDGAPLGMTTRGTAPSTAAATAPEIVGSAGEKAEPPKSFSCAATIPQASECSGPRREGGDASALASETARSFTAAATAPEVVESAGEKAVSSQPARPPAHIPTLRDPGRPALDPREYARTTCFEAGHLVAKNAGWRNSRPDVNHEACTGCLQCYLYCPDGAVYKAVGASTNLAGQSKVSEASCGAPDCGESRSKRASAREKGLEPQDGVPREAAASAYSVVRQNSGIAIDYDFCKGCGICVRVCPADAIAMIPEKQALAAEAAAVATSSDAANPSPTPSPSESEADAR